MEFLKKKWQIIVICILILFGMSKCTSSCTNANKFEESEKARTELVNKMDSTVKVLNDSIVSVWIVCEMEMFLIFSEISCIISSKY